MSLDMCPIKRRQTKKCLSSGIPRFQPWEDVNALIIAVLDILPVLGTGCVLIPWSLISLISRNIAHAAGLLIVYIAITIIRHIVEPKIVGSQIGMHPLFMLASMLLDLDIFAIASMFTLPIAIAFAKQRKKKERIAG